MSLFVPFQRYNYPHIGEKSQILQTLPVGLFSTPNEGDVVGISPRENNNNKFLYYELTSMFSLFDTMHQTCCTWYLYLNGEPQVRVYFYFFLSTYTRWGVITGLPSFKRHNLVNIRFVYMKISDNSRGINAESANMKLILSFD